MSVPLPEWLDDQLRISITSLIPEVRIHTTYEDPETRLAALVQVSEPYVGGRRMETRVSVPMMESTRFNATKRRRTFLGIATFILERWEKQNIAR